MNHAWRQFRNSRIKTHASLMYIYIYMCETRKGKILGQRFLPRTHFRHIYTPRARHETVSRLSSAPQPPIYTYIYIYLFIYIYIYIYIQHIPHGMCLSVCMYESVCTCIQLFLAHAESPCICKEFPKARLRTYLVKKTEVSISDLTENPRAPQHVASL